MPDYFEYNRQAAVNYAHRWAYYRNPEYYDYSAIGGDCTNFASQCIFAGSGIMNYTPTYGWYYRSANDRSASWTGVQYLYNFLTTNKGPGPFGYEAPVNMMMPGDIVQIAVNGSAIHHTPVIVAINGTPSPDTIFIAAHSRDCDCRPLSSYPIIRLRYIHIEGVRGQP